MTPVGDAVAAEPDNESAIKAAALLAAIEAEGLPIERSAGPVAILLTAAVLFAGGKGVRLTVHAARDGEPIRGWDSDRVHVTPPADFVADGEVREDPLAVCLADLLEYAANAGG